MRTDLRRGAVLLAALLASASLAGCALGHHFVPEGRLEVRNSLVSDAAVVGIELDEVPGPGFLTYDVFVPPGHVLHLDAAPGTYDVTIFWEDGGLETYLDVRLREGRITVLRVVR